MPKRPTHKLKKIQHKPKQNFKIHIPANITSLSKEQLQAIVRILRREENLGLKLFSMWVISKPFAKASAKPLPDNPAQTDELFESSDPPGTDF